MKRHAHTLLAALVILATPGIADAQARSGRATGSRTVSRASAPAASGRIASRRAGDDVIRGSTSSISRRSAQEPIRGRTATSRSTGIDDVRGRSSTVRRTNDVIRGGSRSGAARGGVSSAAQRGSIGDRPGRASGGWNRDGSYDRAVSYPVQGRAYGTDRYYDSRDRRYYGSYPRHRYVSYGPRVYYPRPLILRGCAFTFGYGSAGFGCIHTFAGPGLFIPFFYIYPRHVVHVHTSASYGTPTYATTSTYYDEADDPTCAIVTVTQPGNDGYWKTLRLPVAGATTRDQLRRVVADRVRAGAAFDLVDVDGVGIHIPAGVQIQSVSVDPCR